MTPTGAFETFALMTRLRRMTDAEYLYHLSVYHAAPTLMGLKPATLICPDAGGRDLAGALAECARRLGENFGARVAAFHNRTGALLLLIHHRGRLRAALSDREAGAVLAEAGYGQPADDLDGLLGQLGKRCAGESFPHEIGVFLGYPPDDVRMFMRRGGGTRPGGRACWKCFGDVKNARGRSNRYLRAKRRAARLILTGGDLQALAVPWSRERETRGKNHAVA